MCILCGCGSWGWWWRICVFLGCIVSVGCMRLFSGGILLRVFFLFVVFVGVGMVGLWFVFLLWVRF